MPTILLADDHRIVRQGIRLTLEQFPGNTVIAEAENGLDALEMASVHNPDVVLVDIAMPGMNGIDLTRALCAEDSRRKIIILSMHTEKRFVLDAFAAGAAGYVVKTATPEQLSSAITAVCQGQSYISPEVSGIVLQEMTGTSAAPPTRLTTRERQILQLLTEGRNAKEAASELGISDKTVHAFRAQIMRKLDLHSMAELTKFAIRNGITTLE